MPANYYTRLRQLVVLAKEKACAASSGAILPERKQGL